MYTGEHFEDAQSGVQRQVISTISTSPSKSPKIQNLKINLRILTTNIFLHTCKLKKVVRLILNVPFVIKKLKLLSIFWRNVNLYKSFCYVTQHYLLFQKYTFFTFLWFLQRQISQLDFTKKFQIKSNILQLSLRCCRKIPSLNGMVPSIKNMYDTS